MNAWPAYFYLEKGHLFEGEGFGAQTVRGGEAVFNTGMSGYQEIFTDPSYYQQVVVMTYPMLGNTGTNLEDLESKKLYLSGVVAREYCAEPSSWRNKKSLTDYLNEASVPAIAQLDTRRITEILRDEGSQRCIIFPASECGAQSPEDVGRALIANVASMEGLGLVDRVSCQEGYDFGDKNKANPLAVVYDFGVKTNILRGFHSRGFNVRVVPHNFPYQEVMALNPSAVVLSNGPGDPACVEGSVEQIQGLMGKLPIFAICMGHQLLARAAGCTTYKLKFGHHGINHPVKDLLSGKILITSQNHGFTVRKEDLAAQGYQVSHISLNDDTVEGFCSEKMKFLSVQFHPEAKPGPSDASVLFDTFLKGFFK